MSLRHSSLALLTNAVAALAMLVAIGCGDDTGGAGGAGGAGGSGGSGGTGGSGGGGATTAMSFFVTSQTNMTGNLGGLAGADQRCQTLAAAAGAGAKTWHAYLSAANGGNPIHAKDRIGTGPWFNSKGVMVAQNVAELHALLPGPTPQKHMFIADHTVLIDEQGNSINGQWVGSPAPVQHDILTGSADDGTLLINMTTMSPMTCADWTSDSTMLAAQVGHADGLGPAQATTPNNLSSWNSAHANMDCSNTAPRGGSGRIYCFAL